MKTQKIAIVGAGVMGRTLAWQLLRDAQLNGRAIQLTIIDKDPIASGNAAAYTAAGMLTPYCEVETAETLVFEMGLYSLNCWPALVESLKADIGFHQNGSLVVAHGNDRADFQRFLHQLKSKLDDNAKNQFEILNADALKTHSPELAPVFREALSIPNESWVNSHLYMTAIAQQLLSHGVTWLAEKTVASIEQNTRGASVLIDGERYTYNRVIDCRGLQAKQDISELRGVRGEVMTLHAPEVNIKTLVRLMHPRYRLYLVPRNNNTYLLGATQIESEDTGDITVRSALELLSAVYSLHAGFSEAKVIATATNCRPALRDNLPKIIEHDNIVRINGLYRHGFLLAPVVAEEASNSILDLNRPVKFSRLFSAVKK